VRTLSAVSNERGEGGEGVEEEGKGAELDGEVGNEIKKITIFIAYILIVLFTLLPKISSIVYKKGCSISASSKLPFSFP